MFRRMAITMVPFQDGPAGKDFGQRLRVQMGMSAKTGGFPGAEESLGLAFRGTEAPWGAGRWLGRIPHISPRSHAVAGAASFEVPRYGRTTSRRLIA